MELKTRFKVIMSSEADAFLDTLRQDVKDKIIYNVDKVAMVIWTKIYSRN